MMEFLNSFAPSEKIVLILLIQLGLVCLVAGVILGLGFRRM
jgi:hypothetical protein